MIMIELNRVWYIEWRRQWHPTPVLLPGKIPWTEETGRLQSIGSLRVGHLLSDFTFTFHFHALEKEMAANSSVLAWRIPGMGEPGGLPPMQSHRVKHDWSDLPAYRKYSINNEWMNGPEARICVLNCVPGQWISSTGWQIKCSLQKYLHQGEWIQDGARKAR